MIRFSNYECKNVFITLLKYNVAWCTIIITFPHNTVIERLCVCATIELVHNVYRVCVLLCTVCEIKMCNKKECIESTYHSIHSKIIQTYSRSL
jgi:hypothetical protein